MADGFENGMRNVTYGVCFCDLNKFVDSRWIVWVLIWMFLS